VALARKAAREVRSGAEALRPSTGKRQGGIPEEGEDSEDEDEAGEGMDLADLFEMIASGQGAELTAPGQERFQQKSHCMAREGRRRPPSRQQAWPAT
jgi:hypothetical protein